MELPEQTGYYWVIWHDWCHWELVHVIEDLIDYRPDDPFIVILFNGKQYRLKKFCQLHDSVMMIWRLIEEPPTPEPCISYLAEQQYITVPPRFSTNPIPRLSFRMRLEKIRNSFWRKK